MSKLRCYIFRNTSSSESHLQFKRNASWLIKIHFLYLGTNRIHWAFKFLETLPHSFVNNIFWKYLKWLPLLAMNLLFMIRVLLSLTQSFEILIGILLNQGKNPWNSFSVIRKSNCNGVTKRCFHFLSLGRKKIIIEYKYSWIGS